MRIFKYWKKATRALKIWDTNQPSSCYGGSNISIEDAEKDGEKKLQKAQDIIDGKSERDKVYEVDIMEEIIYEIDHDNIVTRNRYGALVLNCKNLMIIDVDDYKIKLWDYILGKTKGKSKKEKIFSQIEKKARSPKFENLGFRIYETFKGYRIIIIGKIFDARSNESKNLMNEFYSDYLYQSLCLKQNCYRARLTPKPYRINLKRHKIIFPDRNESEEAEHKNWVEKYEMASERYSTCYLTITYGMQKPNRIIEYHDEITKVRQKRKLA